MTATRTWTCSECGGTIAPGELFTIADGEFFCLSCATKPTNERGNECARKRNRS